MAQSIYKNALFKGLLSFCNIAVPLLVIPYVYRVLDPTTIGTIEYGNSIYVYFYIFGSLGIYGYGLREISKVRNHPHLVTKIYHNLFSIGLVSNGLALLLFVLFAFLGFENATIRAILLILSIGLIANALYTEWINEAYEEFVFITLKTLIIRVLSVIAIFLLVKRKDDFYIYVLITVLVLLLNNLVSFIYALRYTKFSFNLSTVEWRKYLPPLFFIFILNNSNVLYTTLDRTMLGTYTGVESVAFYSLGQKVMEIIRAILMTAIFVSMPRLSYYLENDYNHYKSALKDLSRLILFMAIPASVGLILMSKEVVLLFAGDQYYSAILPSQIFSFRILVLSIESLIAQQILFLHGKEKVILTLNIIFGLLNLSLNFVFVGVLTPAIAIATTTIAEILLVSSEIIYVKLYLKLELNLFSKSNGLYLIGALLFIPIVMLIRSFTSNNLYVLSFSIVICGMFFIGTMLALKESMATKLLGVLKNKAQ